MTIAQLNDEEMRAIFLYFRSLPPREFGQNTSRRSLPPDVGPDSVSR